MHNIHFDLTCNNYLSQETSRQESFSTNKDIAPRASYIDLGALGQAMLCADSASMLASVPVKGAATGHVAMGQNPNRLAPK